MWKWKESTTHEAWRAFLAKSTTYEQNENGKTTVRLGFDGQNTVRLRIKLPLGIQNANKNTNNINTNNLLVAYDKSALSIVSQLTLKVALSSMSAVLVVSLQIVALLSALVSVSPVEEQVAGDPSSDTVAASSLFL